MKNLKRMVCIYWINFVAFWATVLGFFLIFGFYNFVGSLYFYIPIFISFFKFSFDLVILFDWVSLMFFAILMIISGGVLFFGRVYMESDFNQFRFFAILLCFIFSMGILIFTPHYVFLLLGWDGLGLTSFLLISYYNCSSSFSASFKTYIINRLGDGFMLCALGLILYKNLFWFRDYSLKIFLLCLFMSFFTKSAQFPFGRWLPEAMAAPTPVSALVHSSTLVTAGLYLFIRLYYKFSSDIQLLAGILGLWTLFIASLAALVEIDRKKIIAFSTMSQLGLMVVALYAGKDILAFFHLLTHAVFKALLFIVVGFFLLIKNHTQDIRKSNKRLSSFPLLSLLLVHCLFTLSGLNFLSGFFSKEKILESFGLHFKIFFKILFWFSLIFTVIYSFRLFRVITNNYNLRFTRVNYFKNSQNSNFPVFSWFPLFFISVILGFLLKKIISQDLCGGRIFKLLILVVIYLPLFLFYFYNKVFPFFSRGNFSDLRFLTYFNSKIFLIKIFPKIKLISVFLDQGWFSHLIKYNFFFRKNYNNSFLINKLGLFNNIKKYFFFLIIFFVCGLVLL